MKIISISAHHHQIYTNHSIRATTMTLLDNVEIAARHIMRTPGHKSEALIRSHSSRMNDCQKRNISDVLSTSLNPSYNSHHISITVPDGQATSADDQATSNYFINGPQ